MNRLRPEIRKLGTIDSDIVETTPLVFQNTLYRFEYIRKRYKSNATGDSYFRFIDIKTGKSSLPFAVGFHLGSAFVHKNTVYVFAVQCWGGSSIYMFQSDDLINWSSPELILSDKRWAAYNSSVCYDGKRFILAYELLKPEEEVGIPFTIFFAESPDLQHWQICKDVQPFTKDRYSASPTIRYVNGFYYLIYLEGAYDSEYKQHIVRSTDLDKWEQSPLNPFLKFSSEDFKIANNRFTDEQINHIKSARNINNSDVDLCDYDGKIWIYYSWGDQKGVEFLAQAEADGTLDKFLESWFPA